MTDREATKVLAEASRQAVVETWGEPDGMLSGLYGDVYGTPAGLHIIIYYDVSLNSGPRVQAVKIGS